MGLGSEIRDPEKTYSGPRIQGSKRHRIPDPDPQHWYLLGLLDPDPLVKGMDEDADPDASITKQKKNNKNLDSYCFVTSL